MPSGGRAEGFPAVPLLFYDLVVMPGSLTINEINKI